MKKTNYILAVILMIASFGTFAQKATINSKKSTINWTGKKLEVSMKGSSILRVEN